MIWTHESGRLVLFGLTHRIPEQAVRLVMRFEDRRLPTVARRSRFSILLGRLSEHLGPRSPPLVCGWLRVLTPCLLAAAIVVAERCSINRRQRDIIYLLRFTQSQEDPACDSPSFARHVRRQAVLQSKRAGTSDDVRDGRIRTGECSALGASEHVLK